jgi:hypothetical protein
MITLFISYILQSGPTRVVAFIISLQIHWEYKSNGLNFICRFVVVNVVCNEVAFNCYSVFAILDIASCCER